jgi:hypothetical protein
MWFVAGACQSKSSLILSLLLGYTVIMAHASERLIFPFFGIALATLVMSEIAARMFSLYWVYPWFDMPMHLLGGATIALGFHSMPSVVKHIPEEKRTFLLTVLVVFALGLCWEMFEYATGASRNPGLFSDTASDLSCDFIGAVCGYYFVRALRGLA